MKAGDLVTQIDDQRVTTADSLIAAVRSHAPGEQVKVAYVRGGKSQQVRSPWGPRTADPGACLRAAEQRGPAGPGHVCSSRAAR